jgi:hypothetical protein
MAALRLCSAAIALAMAAARLSRDPSRTADEMFTLPGVTIMAGGLFAARVTRGYLPKGARRPFRAMGVICISPTAVLFDVTCGLATAPRAR